MKKLILKLIIIISLILVSCAAILLLTPLDESHYLRELPIKHELIKKTDSPKVILVGGSGLAFGFDSMQLKEKTGLNVVNMALHAGFGLQYMLEEVKPYIYSGDIVVIISEYDYFFNPVLYGGTALNEMLFFFPRGAAFLSSKNCLSILQNFPEMLQRCYSTTYDSVIHKKIIKINKNVCIYCKDSFNEYGDATRHLKLPLPEKFNDKYGIVKVNKYSLDAVNILNNFYSFIQKKNAAVYFIYPSIPDYVYNKNKKNIKSLHTYIKKRLKIRVLGEPDNFIYPRHCFYDTYYHMNHKGRLFRTERVIELLKAEILKTAQKE